MPNTPNHGRALEAGRFLFGPQRDLPKVIDIDLNHLRPNPDQPRRHFEPAALRDLADSIERHGLLQPIVVCKDAHSSQPEAHIIVAGERRYRAFRLLGRTRIPAIRTQGQPDELALIENIQRENLNPLEEAEAYQRLLSRYGYSQGDLATVVGKGRKTVNELLQLVSLPDAIKADCRDHGITVSKSLLLEIARESDPERQQALWAQVQSGVFTNQRALAAARKTQRPAPGSGVPLRTLLQASHRFAQRLNAFQAQPQTLSPQAHAELWALHQRLTAFFAGLPQTGAENAPHDDSTSHP